MRRRTGIELKKETTMTTAAMETARTVTPMPISRREPSSIGATAVDNTIIAWVMARIAPKCITPYRSAHTAPPAVAETPEAMPIITRYTYAAQSARTSASLVLLALVQAEWAAYVYLVMIGMASGVSATAGGAVWAERYGIMHLGAIRAMTQAIMVLSTAAAPILLGSLLDAGIGVTVLAISMAAVVLVVSFLSSIVKYLTVPFLPEDKSRHKP